MSDEAWFARVTRRCISGREDAFHKGVRERDGKCVISGKINHLAQWDVWVGFKAAHVFPLEHENLWIDDVVGSSKINSIQNGLLITATLHTCFDQYLFSINPDVSILQLKLISTILMQ